MDLAQPPIAWLDLQLPCWRVAVVTVVDDSQQCHKDEQIWRGSPPSSSPPPRGTIAPGRHRQKDLRPHSSHCQEDLRPKLAFAVTLSTSKELGCWIRLPPCVIHVLPLATPDLNFCLLHREVLSVLHPAEGHLRG